MVEKNLKNKDASIQIIVNKILDYYDAGYFDEYYSNGLPRIVDFWEADLFAVGLKKKEKSIYISSWDYRSNSISNMLYYVEFELIDIDTFDTKHVIKKISGINADSLVKEIKLFLQ